MQIRPVALLVAMIISMGTALPAQAEELPDMEYLVFETVVMHKKCNAITNLDDIAKFVEAAGIMPAGLVAYAQHYNNPGSNYPQMRQQATGELKEAFVYIAQTIDNMMTLQINRAGCLVMASAIHANWAEWQAELHDVGFEGFLFFWDRSEFEYDVETTRLLGELRYIQDECRFPWTRAFNTWLTFYNNTNDQRRQHRDLNIGYTMGINNWGNFDKNKCEVARLEYDVAGMKVFY